MSVASDSIESDAVLDSPHTVVSDYAHTSTGPGAKRHTVRDSEDILYCFLWAKKTARALHGGYSKFMFEKWLKHRPDKPMSVTALATKGKRLYDRASKDLGGKGWLGLLDLQRIAERVDGDLLLANVCESSCVEEVGVVCGDVPSVVEDDNEGGCA